MSWQILTIPPKVKHGGCVITHVIKYVFHLIIIHYSTFQCVASFHWNVSAGMNGALCRLGGMNTRPPHGVEAPGWGVGGVFWQRKSEPRAELLLILWSDTRSASGSNVSLCLAPRLRSGRFPSSSHSAGDLLISSRMSSGKIQQTQIPTKYNCF